MFKVKKKKQNSSIDVVLVFLLFTLNMLIIFEQLSIIWYVF